MLGPLIKLFSVQIGHGNKSSNNVLYEQKIELSVNITSGANKVLLRVEPLFVSGCKSQQVTNCRQS